MRAYGERAAFFPSLHKLSAESELNCAPCTELLQLPDARVTFSPASFRTLPSAQDASR